jgi:hypothetical protein
MQTYEATMHRVDAELATGESGARATRGGEGEPAVVVTAAARDLALWAWIRGGSVSISGEPSSAVELARDSAFDCGAGAFRQHQQPVEFSACDIEGVFALLRRRGGIGRDPHRAVRT